MGVKITPVKPSTNLRNKSILSIQQFNKESLAKIFSLAGKMKGLATGAKPSKILAGRIVVLLFYEPSSRTLSSFDAAVKQLGGQTIVINNPTELSSVAKGETFEDTIKTLEAYCDAIVIRHPKVGFAIKAANAATNVPIINAGDGVGEHPTQALLDLYTIWNFKKRLTNLKGLIIGDGLNARALHSLIKGIGLNKKNVLYLLSPKELRLSKELSEQIKSTSDLKLIEIDDDVEKIPKDCDFWYVTRIQKERFKKLEDFEKVNRKIIVTKELVAKYGNNKMIIMHCLPKVGEIEKDLDNDKRAVYLTDQIRNGMYIRMALLSLILARK